MKRGIVIGDVHGCSEELSKLLDEVRITSSDSVYLLGDLVNRGPDPHGVFEILRGLANVRCLWGNHELRLLKYKKSKNPLDLKAADWETLPKLTSADWDFMENRMERPFMLEEFNTVLVHGGFLPMMPWYQQPLSVTTRIQVVGVDNKAHKRADCPKGIAWQELWKGPPFVIYGHTPQEKIQKRLWSLGIDTGCVLGGYLTACILPSREIIQIPAKKKYHTNPLFFERPQRSMGG